MKNLLAGILLAALLCYVVHLCLHPDAVITGAQGTASTPDQVEPSTPKHKTVNATVRFNSTTIGVRNDDRTNWPALNVLINGIMYRHTIAPLAPGEAVTIPLVEFANYETGERFDPFRFKLTRAALGGNGYEYEDFAP
jgi:hypothetical protein